MRLALATIAALLAFPAATSAESYPAARVYTCVCFTVTVDGVTIDPGEGYLMGWQFVSDDGGKSYRGSTTYQNDDAVAYDTFYIVTPIALMTHGRAGAVSWWVQPGDDPLSPANAITNTAGPVAGSFHSP